MNALEKAFAAIDLKFRSGNSVPIDRAWVRKAEWEALKAAIGQISPDEFNAEAEKARERMG